MALWNFTIDDASPYLSYNPYVDNPTIVNSWRTWYTESQYNTIPDEVSRGDSYHITSLANASVTLQFYGTGISLFGSSNMSFNVMVDNIPQPMSSTMTSLLYANYTLPEGLHSVTLSAQGPTSNSSQLAFNSAIVSLPLRDIENPPSPIIYDSSNTALLQYSGAWTTETTNGVPNATTTEPFQQTTVQDATVSMSFTGGTAVVVKGMTGSANGIYSVMMDGSTSTFNGSSAWIIPDALLFFRAGLDPATTHHIKITNIDGTRLCLNSITVYQYEPKNISPASSSETSAPPHHHSANIGAIIGPVVGVFILLIIIIIAFMWCRRSRHRLIAESEKPHLHPINVPDLPITPRSPGKPPSPVFSGSTYVPSDISDANSNTNLLDNRRSSSGITLLSRRNAPPIPLTEMSSRRSQITSPMSQDGPSIPSPTIVSHSSGRTVDLNPSHSGVQKLRHSRSAQTFSSPESIALPPRRKPLPNIPLPSYDVALQAAQLSPEEAKGIPNPLDGDVGAAPPRYER